MVVKISNEKKATREGYGDALLEEGSKNSKIIALDADLSGSTKTNKFSHKFPDRFFNVGVAEQNLVGVAAGFALSGFVPFASSFAMFLAGRAWEIVRNSVVYPKLNVKLVASHGGVTVGEDGASHQCIEDFAIMRVIPDMTVICPSDYNETKQVISEIIKYKGPVYVRVGRPNIPVLERDNYNFKIGKAEVLSEGNDVCIIATGILVGETIKSVEILRKNNIEATLLNMSTIKPIDKENILKYAKRTSFVLTCEEHNIVGGLGSAVSEFLSENYPVKVIRLGVRDHFGKSGKWEQLLNECKISSVHIEQMIRKVLNR